MIKLVTVFFVAVLLFSGCEQNFVPKPHGYPQIALPENTYQKLELDLPYTFEHSVFSKATKNDYVNAGSEDINLNYDSISNIVAIHITYKRLDKEGIDLNSVLKDSQELISKHNVKSSGTGYETVVTPSGMYATLVKIDGEVPNPYQFYVHDSTTHYLRGALYFKTATKNDSLAPLIDYTQKDLLHILQTLSWKE